MKTAKLCWQLGSLSAWKYPLMNTTEEDVEIVNRSLVKSGAGLDTYLGNASKQYVFFVSGKATLMPEVSGECRTTAAHS